MLIYMLVYFNIYIISILFCHFRHQIREPCTNKHSKTCSKCHIGKKNDKNIANDCGSESTKSSIYVSNGIKIKG